LSNGSGQITCQQHGGEGHGGEGHSRPSGD
jgi:hypothetical protein